MAFVAAAPLSLNRRPAGLALGAASSPALTGGYPVCPVPSSVVVARPAAAKWSMARVAKVRRRCPICRIDPEERPPELRIGDLASSRHPEGHVALASWPWQWCPCSTTFGSASDWYVSRLLCFSSYFVTPFSWVWWLFIVTCLLPQFGPFTPLLKLTRLVIGDKPLNKLRGKGIALHSQVCLSCDSPFVLTVQPCPDLFCQH